MFFLTEMLNKLCLAVELHCKMELNYCFYSIHN